MRSFAPSTHQTKAAKPFCDNPKYLPNQTGKKALKEQPNHQFHLPGKPIRIQRWLTRLDLTSGLAYGVVLEKLENDH